MAVEELNREIVKTKARFEVSKNTYIPPCPLKKANKRFLSNTIQNALNFNRRKGQSTRIKSMKRLIEVEERTENPESAKKPEKFGDRQHIYKKKKMKRKDREETPPRKSSSHRKPHQSSDDEVIVLD